MFMMLAQDISPEQALFAARHVHVVYSVTNRARVYGTPSSVQSFERVQMERLRALRAHRDQR